MAYDLILTLSAAVLIGFVPGYFWSRCLVATDDLTVRIAYAIALSITLVAAVALVPTRLLGMGISLPVTAVCVMLVFLSGIAAYSIFGPAKGPESPLATPPRPLGLPTLALTGVALALALGIAFEYLPLWGTVPYVVAIVVLAGITQLLLPARQASPAPSSPEEPAGTSGGHSRTSEIVWKLLTPAVFALVLFRGYSGPVLNEWPFIRGVDHYSHAVMANLMMTEGKIEPYLIYPPGFHTMSAMISRLSGLDPLEIFPVLGPALFLLPALAVYTLAGRIWGRSYGTVAALFSSVILGGSYRYLDESMYPNLVTSQFLLILAIAALFRFYATASIRTALTVALLGSSVVLYHQVSSLYLVLLLLPVGIFFLPYLLLRHRRQGIVLALSLALLGVLSVLYAWDTYNLPGLIGGLLEESQASETGSAIEMAIGTQPLYIPSDLLLQIITQPVAWLGLLGALLLLGGLKRRVSTGSAAQSMMYLTLLWWGVLMLVGSLTAYSGFPQRFSRDLGIPLSLLSALAIFAIFRPLRTASLSRPAAAGLAVFAALTASTLVGYQVVQSLEKAAGPSNQTTITAEIAAAGEWLEEHNTGGNIIVSPHVNQVPSRMMLAMGDYSALQSFELVQIMYPRDLPPTGAEPLRDVIWVMQNPVGDTTRQILEKYDIRYLVFYKNMPDRETLDYWIPFTQRPELYDTAFENEDVIIFEPKAPLIGGIEE
ncbi:MAG: hypothetical protein WA990_04635 [Rubrobacteraceae bacterium]